MPLIRLGTRGSALARWQSDNIAARLATAWPDLLVSIVEIVSTGDRVTDVPLSSVEGTGFFTATIERALLAGDVDVAVHSYKDLPVEPTPGLVVAAVPVRGPVEDVLCARGGLTLEALPAGARIGTCSARRMAQIRAIRRDLDIVPLRGNVPTRIAKVESGELDAIVLARAGLVRLGLDAHISQVFAPDRIVPAPAQGALAVQCREDDCATADLLRGLDDPRTRREVQTERTVLHALGGGCAVPVGAFAHTTGSGIHVHAVVLDLDGRQSARAEADGVDPEDVGTTAARRLLDGGAGNILTAFLKRTRLASYPDTGDQT